VQEENKKPNPSNKGNVQSHDILYKVFRDILYTPALVRPARRVQGWRDLHLLLCKFFLVSTHSYAWVFYRNISVSVALSSGHVAFANTTLLSPMHLISQAEHVLFVHHPVESKYLTESGLT